MRTIPNEAASRLQQSANALWEMHYELTSYSFLLLQGLSTDVEACEKLYGLGISLRRVANRASQLAERLESLANRKKQPIPVELRGEP